MSGPLDRTVYGRQKHFKATKTMVLIFCASDFSNVAPDRQVTVNYVDKLINTTELIDGYRTKVRG